MSTSRSISIKRSTVDQCAASWGNDGVPINASLREFEVRVVSRQDPDDLKCDANVRPASGSRSGSTQKIKTASLLMFSSVIRDKVLNTLPQMLEHHWFDVSK